MPLIHLLLLLVLVGVGLYLVNSVIPMDPAIKKILNVVVIVVVSLWVLSAFGIFDIGYAPHYRTK